MFRRILKRLTLANATGLPWCMDVNDNSGRVIITFKFALTNDDLNDDTRCVQIPFHAFKKKVLRKLHAALIKITEETDKITDVYFYKYFSDGRYYPDWVTQYDFEVRVHKRKFVVYWVDLWEIGRAHV